VKRLLPLAALLLLGAGPGSLDLLSPEEGTPFGYGDRMLVWTAGAGRSVLFSVSKDAGASWIPLAERPATDGIWFWDPKGIPDGARIRLRLELQDADRKSLGSVERNFLVDRTPPRTRLTGPTQSVGGSVILQVEKSDAASGLASLAVWSTQDGKTWSLALPGASPEKPLEWTAPHRGRWGLYVSGQDRAGNEGAAPGEGTEPQLWITVRTPEPWVGRLDLALPGPVLRPGDPLTISWDVTGDGNERIRLERHTGKDWEVMAEGLKARGELAWKTPAVHGPLSEMRLVALTPEGLRGVRELWPPAWVDAQAPEVILSAPALWEKDRPVDLEVRADDVPAGIRRTILWGLKPSGEAWERLGEFTPMDPVRFLPDCDGAWGLWLQAEDKVGNATAAPQARDMARPMARVLVDRVPPRASFRAPKGGELLAASGRLRVSWVSSDASLLPRPAALFSSRDAGASWELEAEGLSAEGDLDWQAPATSGPLWLRLAVLDAAGRRGEALLEHPVTVRPGIPETARVPVPEVPEMTPEPKPAPQTPPGAVEPASLHLLSLPGVVQGGKPLALRWKAPAAAAGLEVEASVSDDGGRHWKGVGRVAASGEGLDWKPPVQDIPDLRIRLTLWKGRTDLGTSPERRLAVASKPPKVRLVPLPAAP